MMMRSMKSQPFVNTTIYKYLWNETDPMMKFSQSVAPNLVPTKNVGILARVSLLTNSKNFILMFEVLFGSSLLYTGCKQIIQII